MFAFVSKLRGWRVHSLVELCSTKTVAKFVGENSPNLVTLLMPSVTRCVCEKVAQNVAQPIFVKINRQLLQWKNVAQLFVLYLSFSQKYPK
jgi:hypothetical protein